MAVELATVHFQDGTGFGFTHEYEPKPSTHYRNRLGEIETIFAAPENSIVAFYTRIEPLCVIRGDSSVGDLAKTAMMIERELARLGNRVPREFKWIREYRPGDSEFIFALDPWDKPRMRAA